MKIEEWLSGVKTIGISGHIRPDGDCVGSCMGLYLYLKKNYPDIHATVFLEEIPEEYKIIPHTEEIRSVFPAEEEPLDLFFALDCGEERLGEARELFQNAKKTVNIDHHISNLGTGKINYIVPDASSTSELIFDLTDSQKYDTGIAMALYMGIVTDTGVFKYSNTSPETMRKAGELLRFDFDHNELIDHVFYEKTWLQNLLLGRALIESILFMDDRCIASCLTKRIMDFYHAKPSDTDGIVSQLHLTAGVECTIFMYEIKTQVFRVSLRSRGAVDVAKIAAVFGGGGHARAAGCTLGGTRYDVINNLSRYVEEQLNAKKTSM